MSELSSADQQKVKGGGQVMVTEPIDGYPWPRVKVYQSVNATPREVMAVFTDYGNACKFVPNCLKSQISKEITPLAFDVDYVIDVPIFSDEAYTVRDTLSREAGGALRVTWKLIKATSILESSGNLYAEPRGAGTVIRYTNLVRPSSQAAMLLKGMALSQMRDTVEAIVANVKDQKENSGAFKVQLERLDAALGAED
jgi:hypothetical protein